VSEARRAPIRAVATVVDLACEGGPNHRLALRVPGWTGFEPGQFVMLSPGPLESAWRSDPLLPRPMAVYRQRGAGAEPVIEILFKRHGRGTALLAACTPGARVGIVGPLGHGFPAPRARRAVLVAGGTGIASVYELAARLAASGQAPVSVLLGARSAADLMGESDFAALGVPLEIATEDGTRGTRGRVTDLLEAALSRDPAAHVYACGPTAMMQRCAGQASAHGAACSVSLENPMACGFGACLGCAAPVAGGGFALVCRDGPVFDGEQVDWGRMP
jgi:dihydroorotate dehydrogenase electron transfer subunit